MKVAFWSSERNRGVTSCTLAAAYLGAVHRNMRITMLDNHYSDRKLGRLILGQENGLAGYFGLTGPWCGEWIGPGYYRGLTGRRGYTDIELIDDHLWFRYTDVQGDECMFEEEFVRHVQDHARSDRLYFIDTQGERNISTKEILETADLVIIMLPDETYRLNIFLDKYSSLISKSIFVFNKFRSDRKNIHKEICIQHGIDEDRLITIPYVREISDSVSLGRFGNAVSEFVNGNSSQAADMYFSAVERLLGKIERESRRCGNITKMADIQGVRSSLPEPGEAREPRPVYCSWQRDLHITASACL